MTDSTAAQDESFVISRVFNASRQRLWDAWTNPEQLGKWFGPKGSKTAVKTQDLRPGGLLHSCLESPDGGRMWAKFVYREVVPPSRLVWLQSFSDEHAGVTRAPFFGGNWPLALLTTVTLAQEGIGTGTTLTWTPHDATEIERQTFTDNMDSMKQGWTGSFDQLDALLG